ncbi:ATP-binding cassette domain-containing protein [Methanocalculus sp.]|uniref:ATP-binding cassette domain-containing protein n=1 Tax=Methanocalculus sp. TaxID=2004547 RepID=UPI002602B23B|nr:ATP-binding cassette domain-containing protein [Methanocalculus sp.]MDG6250201.1 ATP-binding cassette domain-containing protein [Methanocalculus sp.]
MKVGLDEITFQQGRFALSVNQEFVPGIYLITGPIGSGKSTLSLILSGHLPPDSGSIHKTGITSEAISLQFPEYHITGATVLEEIRSWGVDPDMIESAILPKTLYHRDPLQLSRGELKRLSLACLFAREPDLLILDEPFSSLDAEMKQWLCTMIERRRSGITIIFTHEREILPDTAFHLSMRNGSLYPGDAVSGILKGAVEIPTDVGEKPPFFGDGRLRLLSVILLSLGAFLTIGGAILALLWWVVACWRRWEIPNKHLILALGMLILLPALVTEFFTGGGLSYGIRMGVILFISFWVYTDYRGGEMLDLFVWAGSERKGFDIGLAAEMAMQGIYLAGSDLQQIRRAYSIKGLKIGVKTFIPAAISLLLMHIRRSDETALLLALRGFNGGGTYVPCFPGRKRDFLLTLIAIIPLFYSLLSF